jgi:hypothetical protein
MQPRAALGHANYVAGDLNAAASVLPGLHTAGGTCSDPDSGFCDAPLTQAELGQVERSCSSAEGAMELVEARAFMPCPLFPCIHRVRTKPSRRR